MKKKRGGGGTDRKPGVQEIFLNQVRKKKGKIEESEKKRSEGRKGKKKK
jgi:hypothetical protein